MRRNYLHYSPRPNEELKKKRKKNIKERKVKENDKDKEERENIQRETKSKQQFWLISKIER